MRIAICDDVEADRRAIAAALDEYLKVRGLTAEVREFARPTRLSTAVEREPFDLYLLDVLLDDEMTGIDLVRQLHPNGSRVPVVFFSTSREYAIDAFAVEAISYLQKPWDKASFARVLDLAMERCRAWENSMLTLRTGSGVVRLAASEIESVETARTVNYIAIRRAGTNSIVVRGSVRTFAEQYQDQIRLVPAGRSIILNPAQIASLEKSSVRFFSGRTLAIPQSALVPLSKEILALSAPNSSTGSVLPS